MTFYSKWKNAIDNQEKYMEYIIAFLNKEQQTEEVFLTGNTEEIEEAIEVIVKIPLEFFFESLDCIDFGYQLEAADVPQFSNLEHGLVRVPELLAFSDEGLTYYEIGYQIVKAVKVGACVKYGENHSKLASIFSLVEINNTRPAVVKNTALGAYLISMSYEEKNELLRRLLMRDKFMKVLLKEARNGFVVYEELVKFLSPSTALRRRPNVKRLMEFILVHTEYENYYRNISW